MEKRAVRCGKKKYEVTGEDERFWYCKGTQFRKRRTDVELIVVIEKDKEEAEENADQRR